MLQQTYILSFTHKKFSAEELACLYIEPANQPEILQSLKQKMDWDELMYIGTCNRIELVFVSKEDVTTKTVMDVLSHMVKVSQNFSMYAEKTTIYRGFDAVRHLFRVASSLDSLVVGEREIITQVRTSFDFFYSFGL
jgi:glutamyl-tRNA reductase